MTGDEIRALRKRYGWTQKQLGELVANALDRAPASTVDHLGHWERGRRTIPREVQAFLQTLADDPAAAPPPSRPAAAAGPDDTEPRDFELGPPAPVLAIGSSYASLCTQFFELVATAVGMIGAAIGNPRVVEDGQIIDRDKQALGAAYGKLAETNETFRNLIVATDKQGAYLAVALTTGTTVGAIWRNHTITNRDLEAQPLRAVAPPDAADSAPSV